MNAPMTRSALRRAVPQKLRALLIDWFSSGSPRISRELARAGFRQLPAARKGIEKEVLLGPGIVVKTCFYPSLEPPWLERYRRARTLAPTIRIADTIIVQPRGRTISQLRGEELQAAKKKFERSKFYVTTAHDKWDDHKGNYALFPDGTVRCIDY